MLCHFLYKNMLSKSFHNINRNHLQREKIRQLAGLKGGEGDKKKLKDDEVKPKAKNDDDKVSLSLPL